MEPGDDPEPWCTDDPVEEDIIFVMEMIEREDDTHE